MERRMIARVLGLAIAGFAASEVREVQAEELVIAEDEEDEDQPQDDLVLAGRDYTVDREQADEDAEAEDAPDAELPSPGIGDCMLFPVPECDDTLVVELGMGGGESANNVGVHSLFRAFVELGYLMPVTSDLHIGPTFELSVSTHEIAVDWQAGPRVRARWFVGGTLFVMEHALGLEFQRFSYHDALESGTRVGAVTDFGFGYGGIAGPFLQLSALGDPAGESGADLRWVAGVRANLVGWAAAFGGVAYGLSEGF